MTVPLCYYGSPDPLPPRRELRAGPLTAIYEAGDLRYVRVGDVEVCRRWYAAVRDHNWGTVPGVISDEVIEQTANGFRVKYTSTHRQDDIHFVWRADILFENGRVAFDFDGEAKSGFRRNRIGFCVLHPPETCAGMAATLFHPDGSHTDTAFPDRIAPRNPFHELSALVHATAAGVVVQWRFDGDLFETEDQRNWIDASFKTFCTPLRLPFPVEMRAGDRVRQTLTLAVRGASAGASTDAAVSLLAGPTLGRLPALGLGVASHGEPLHEHERGWLRKLAPAFLRADLDLTRADWRPKLRYAADHAWAVGCGLELAVIVSDAVMEETAAIIPELVALNPPVERVMPVHAAAWATTALVVGPVVEAFARAGLHPRVFAGTHANFTELNRRRPPLDWCEGVGYSVQPQEHAFDNASLVECCAALADTVRSARAFCGDRPLSVGPITLRKRVNPYATGPAVPVPPGEPPPTVDARQMSLFGAGWTLAAIKYLAESGVDHVSLYETTGWLGVIERWAGCPRPDRFPSRPRMVFPVWTLLADLTGFAGAEVVRLTTSHPLRCDGLMLRREAAVRVLLANLTDQPLAVRVGDTLPPTVAVREFDETNWEPMTTAPDYYWESETPRPRPTADGSLTLTLRPYAYVRIDGE